MSQGAGQESRNESGWSLKEPESEAGRHDCPLSAATRAELEGIGLGDRS